MTAVESSDRAATRARLQAGAAVLGVELDARALDQLTLFLDELELWNARSNLVGEHDRSTLIDRHVVDALAAVRLLRAHGDRLRIADLGSGAGLPGVPLAIALRPHEMLLVEPRRKRASFLRAVRRRLPDVALRVLECRAEDLDPASAGALDAIVSRAALPEDRLGRAAAPLLRHGGLLIAYRGGPGATGAVSTPRGSEATGPFAPARVESYQLPGSQRRFGLVVRETNCFT